MLLAIAGTIACNSCCCVSAIVPKKLSMVPFLTLLV